MRLSRAASFLALSLLASFAVAQHNAATRPPRVYDLKNVEWHLSFDETLGTIDGDVTNTVVPLKPDTKQVWFDSVKLKINKATVNGKPATVTQKGEQIFISLPKAAGPKDTLAVRLQYTGRPEAGIYFIPAQRAYPATTSVVYTQGEMIDTRYWLPTYDNPDDKTTWDSYVTVPNNYMVITNGREIDTKSHGAKKVVHYRMEKPMSTYLISLIAGQYETGADGHFGSAPVRWNVPVGLAPMGKAAFGGTDKMIAFYSKITGFPYPYAKFEQSAVPDYMFGGMENITAVTQTIDALFPPADAPVSDSQGLVLHELAHQWFGDTVTCAQWQDAWLNEGFATFMPHFYVRETRGEDQYDFDRFGTLQGGTFGGADIPIVWTGYEEPIDEFFVDNIYAGGASRMFWLMHTLGEDKFWAGIKTYLETYKYQPVTTQQFFDSMSKSSGVDLHTFMDQFFMKPGVPNIKVSRDGSDLMIHQSPVYNIDLPVWILDGTTWVKKSVALSGTDTKLAIGELAGKPLLVDPEAYLFGHISYDFPMSADDLMALYRNTPNTAARARLQPLMLQKLSADQLETVAKEEKFEPLLERFVWSLKDDAYLLSLTHSDDPRLVNFVARVPANVTMSDAMAARLRELLNDPHVSIRESAVRSLLTHTKDDALAAKAWASQSFNEGFRNSVMAYYEKNDPDKARELALGELAHPDDELIRRTSIQTLGRLKDKPGERRVFNALVKVVQERSFGARNDAMEALASYGDKAALPYIQPLTTNSMVFTRRTAQSAVQQLGG